MSEKLYPSLREAHPDGFDIRWKEVNSFTYSIQ